MNLIQRKKSTHAIQLRRHFLEELAEEKGFDEIQLQIWDFGGQDIYHATHRLFMQTNALFILVWDQQTENTLSQTEKLDDNSEITYQNYPLRYWLDYAKNLGNRNLSDVDNLENESPILIVQTKKARDKKCEINDWNFLKENYKIIDAISVESSKDKRNGFDQFKSCLEEQIEKMLKETCTALPESWWKVQLDIQKLQSKLTKNITIDKFQKICQKYDLNQDHAKTLLYYLHDTGVLFYRENLFQNKIILDQKWAIEAVYTLFDRKGVFPRLVQKGIFSTQDLKYAWQHFSQDEQELCLDFMKSCEICFEIDYKYEKPFEKRQFLAPALLPENKPIELNEVWQHLKNKHFIRYQYYFLHYGNLQSFIVRTNKWSNPQSLWKNGCQLKDEHGNLALIEGFFSQQKQYLEIQITGENPQQLLDKIRNELEKIQQYDKVSELWSIDGVSFVEREKVEQHPKENLKIQATDGNWLNYSDFALFLNKNPKETFFMPSSFHERKIKSIQDVLEIALEKFDRLNKAKQLENRTDEIMRIDYQLKELEKDIEKHEQELAKLTGNSPAKPTQEKPVKTITSESPKPSTKKIYFSYAWGDKEKGETREEIVNQLYDSLEKDGYTLKRDKMDLGYRGFISDFMQEIGEGDLIVVVISNKYVKSPYCMFELYEIARNCKFDKSLFAQRILPIMVEFIDFSDPFILEPYFEHWEKEEQKWEEFVKKRTNKISPDQFNRYEKVKLIHSNIGKLGDWLIDMNTLNPKMLSENNFEEIKKAIQESN
jgi:GTPase SAR1 family protein